VIECNRTDLARFARFPWVPYIAEDGSTKYYPSLCWAELEPDGTVLARVANQPNVATVYPPFIECDEIKCYNRWLEHDFVLHPNYEIEELGENYAVVRRSDGVRFKVVGRLTSKTLLELAKYPNGINLFEFISIMIGWIAVLDPESHKNPSDALLAEDAGVVICDIGTLYYELGLVEVKRVK